MAPKKLHRVLTGDPRRIHLYLVGCGGTGSFAALNLARLIASDSDRTYTLTLIDPDVVEAKNIGRQYFCPADVGQPKAAVLATRLNMAFGLQMRYRVAPFDEQMLRRAGGFDLQVIIGCVDNPQARASIHEVVADFGWQREMTWWLDAGNDDWTGQILLGNSRNTQPVLTQFGECVELPWPSVQEPALIQPPLNSPQGEGELSCADLVLAGVQARTINYMMAAWLDVYLERLIIQDLQMMRTVINQKTGVTHSQLIDYGEVKGQRVDKADIAEDETPCPQCGEAGLLNGEDEIDDELVEIVFCPECDWQLSAEEFDRAVAMEGALV